MVPSGNIWNSDSRDCGDHGNVWEEATPAAGAGH